MKTAIYPYKANGEGVELRYSLRSLAKHLPEIEEVVLIGDSPPGWYLGRSIRNPNSGEALANVRSHLKLACDDEFDLFLWMMDDVFLRRHYVPEAPAGPTMRELLLSSHGAFRDAVRRTLSVIPLTHDSFELHSPFPVRRDLLQEALRIGHKDNMLVRPVYGALMAHGADSVRTLDPYVWNEESLLLHQHRPWISTGIRFGGTQTFLDWAEKEYPEPSPWENA